MSLVLVAGAGAAALTLGGLDPSQREEEALVYGTLGACIAQQLRGAEACIAAYTSAQETYAATAPRYETEADCQRHHGTGGCTPGAQVTEAARGRYLPVMAAFMMGRTDAQDLPVQPLYPHAPEEERDEAGTATAGHGGGYCTGAGGRVAYAGGASRVHVPASVARTASTTSTTTSTTPRTVSRGGFGGTGRATAFSGGSGGRAGGFGGG
ncbi:membrane protein [Methylobacterium radiotolerans]|nr:membrane protein [Methylobacterium radiotolerans]